MRIHYCVFIPVGTGNKFFIPYLCEKAIPEDIEINRGKESNTCIIILMYAYYYVRML
jgi:hypothetical protein